MPNVAPATAAHRALPPALSNLRSVVLLGGSVRPTDFSMRIGRSVLDLPIDAQSTLLSHWRDEVGALAAALGRGALDLILLIDRDAPEPRTPAGTQGAIARIHRDPLEYRGTGGLLRDLASAYGQEDYLLVTSAAQLLLEPLNDLVRTLATPGADVGLISHADGEPSGLMLIRSGALACLPTQGFVDMKEQALPAIARRHDVRVVQRQHATGLSIRDLADYIQALRAHHNRQTGKAIFADPFAETWQPAYSVVEAGARVDPTARLLDSVVLAGGAVEKDAVVARSVICPNGLVGPSGRAIDQIVP